MHNRIPDWRHRRTSPLGSSIPAASCFSLLLLTFIEATFGQVLAGYNPLPEPSGPAAPHLGTEVQPLGRNQPMVNALQADLLHKRAGREPVGEAVDAATHGRRPRSRWMLQESVAR